MKTKEVNGLYVTYGRIPSGLVEGFSGIVYYFQTFNAYDTELHESAVKYILNSLVDDSYDHGTYWDITKLEAIVWSEISQVTVASFRVKDSY